MNAEHNHRTRVIKERGNCPACDEYHDKQDEDWEDEDFVFVPHATVTVHRGDETHEMALTPACDFCLDARTRWEYPCKRFVLDEIGFGSDDNWLACGRCAELIERGDFGGLSARSVRSWALRYGEASRDDIDKMGQIQHGFFDHRNGSRFPYEP